VVVVVDVVVVVGVELVAVVVAKVVVVVELVVVVVVAIVEVVVEVLVLLGYILLHGLISKLHGFSCDICALSATVLLFFAGFGNLTVQGRFCRIFFK
jgi:hypothetical protein